MGTIVVEMTGDEAKLYRAIIKATEGMKGLEDGTKKVTDASKQATREHEALGKAALRVFEQTRTPQEHYTAQMQRINELVKQGKIDQETYGRAAAQAGQKLRESGEAGQKAFGGQAVAEVKGYVTSILSVAGALGIAKQALTDFEAERAKAGAKASEARMMKGQLAQLEVTSPAEYEAVRKQGQAFYAGGGAASETAAMEAIFRMKSAGLTNADIETLREARASGLVAEPGLAAKAATTIRTSMGAEAGTVRQLLGMGIVASGASPENMQTIMEATARSGTAAKALGISAPELLAATGVQASATGQAEVAATQVRALLNAMEKRPTKEELMAKQALKAPVMPVKEDFSLLRAAGGKETRAQRIGAEVSYQRGVQRYNTEMIEYEAKGKEVEATAEAFAGGFKGMGLAGAVRAIGARNLSDSQLHDLLGDVNAVTAFRTLQQNLPELEARTLKTAQAAKQDVLGQKMKLPMTDPSQRAARLSEESKAALELSKEGLGTGYNLAEAITNEQLVRLQEKEWPQAGTWAAEKAGRFQRWLYGDETFVRGAQGDTTLSPGLQEAIIKHLERISENTGKTANQRNPALAEAHEDR